MPQAVTIAAPGLQALILCGPGSSFPTFTANPDENPKALLPIANRPMVWYPLDFCYRAGITNITLVCPPTASEAINTALNTNPFLTALPYPRPDLLAPKDLDQNTGTAEILRLPELQDRVKSDFLVLPCDLVCELGPDKLVAAWQVKAASLPDLIGGSPNPEQQRQQQQQQQRSGGLSVYYPTKTATPVKGEETDLLAAAYLPKSSVLPPKGSLFPNMMKVLTSMPKDTLKDVLDGEKCFPLSNSMMEKHRRILFKTDYRDAHIYIFPQWVMQFVVENDHLETIGEDVIGRWTKAGYKKNLAKKLKFDKILQKGRESEQDSEEANSSVDVPPVLAYVQPLDPAGPIIRRVDNAQLLLQVSLQLAKQPSIEEAGSVEAAPPYAHQRKIAYPEGIKPRTSITKADSLLADNVTVQEKSSIKESVIGANCQIGEGAKLFQCLLMDGVVVGKNCKLTKCILGKRSDIGEGCVLTDCEVQENLLVEPKTEAKEEKFMSSSGLEATDKDFDDDDDNDDGNDDGSGDDDEEGGSSDEE
ncbi:putative translation initiation factor eIF-2B subunit gamma [Cladorrhinum sp. PSN332]|nr:putative translation initiation factor eIF-2B subunit gamma [Cladorrhinum sp. PSN332]